MAPRQPLRSNASPWHRWVGLCCWLLAFDGAPLVASWTTPRALGVIPLGSTKGPSSTRSTTPRWMASSSSMNYAGDGEEESMDERERMRLVRSLQKTFYASPSEEATNSIDPNNENDDDENDNNLPTALDPSTGILSNLPLWRVGWSEVPGRASCLNVHEIQYTHMFETILNGPKPWYFGHLHLPGGFKMAQTRKEAFRLKTWEEETRDTNRLREPQRSAVVGCLMRISDYRRMEDGRLCLLVHALDRFVVKGVVREFPYSIVDAQILPDREELPMRAADENFAGPARGRAVVKSFGYHPYEFDGTTDLPLPRTEEYLNTRAVSGAAISRLLPFARYSLDKSLLEGLPEDSTESPSTQEGEGDTTATTGFSGGTPALEDQLESWRILGDPSILKQRTRPARQADSDGLETLLWLQLEELVQRTGFVLPAEILALQPPHMDYLDLDSGNAGLDFVHVEENEHRKLSPKYPSYRRQKRLSYALPALLESTAIGQGMRQEWLRAPSTRTRLAGVLELFERVNADLGAADPTPGDVSRDDA